MGTRALDQDSSQPMKDAQCKTRLLFIQQFMQKGWCFADVAAAADLDRNQGACVNGSSLNNFAIVVCQTNRR